VVPEVELSPADQLYLTRFKKLSEILSGELSNALYLEFLYSANKADLQILRNIKTATEVRLKEVDLRIDCCADGTRKFNIAT